MITTLPTRLSDLRAFRDQLARQIAKDDMERVRRDADAIRERCRSFIGFVKAAWHVIEPATPYVHGRHADVIGKHMEAVQQGKIKRIAVNVPPGLSKSTLLSVMFPAWVWGPCGEPGKKFVGLAHEFKLGVRDNLKCRRLITSEWYQALWGDKVRITEDQNEKSNFENTAGGFRQVATIENVTGRRGDFLTLDDMISVKNANSETHLRDIELWLTEAMPTRLNDPDNSAIMLIQQRVHENDPTGVVLQRNWGWDHLCLPMRFEVERRCVTSLGVADWREHEGELLFPERFPERVVAELEKTLGSYATAGQLQQRPAPRDGGMFPIPEDWQAQWVVDSVPAGALTRRGWDLAGSKRKTSAYTVGLKMSRHAGITYIEDVRRGRWSPHEVEQQVVNAAVDDGLSVVQDLPQDPGQAGLAQKRRYAELLAGFRFSMTVESGKKEDRALPLSSQVEAGAVRFVRGPWNSALIEEMRNFPNGSFKDQVDAASRAFSGLLLGDSSQPLGISIMFDGSEGDSHYGASEDAGDDGYFGPPSYD